MFDWVLKTVLNFGFGKRHEIWIEKKQPPEVFYKKDILQNFAKFIGKHLCCKPKVGHFIKKEAPT